MKGLFVKDLRLLLSQKKNLVIFLICGLYMSFFMPGTAFVTVFLTVLSVSYAISTLSYDEFDNGFSFLFTLPFLRRNYVREKYLFSIATSIVIVTLLSLVAVGMTFFSGRMGMAERKVTGTDIAVNAFLAICVAIFMLSVMLPVRLRFGSEQGRIVFLVIYGATIAAAFVIINVVLTAEGGMILDTLGGIAERMEGISPRVMAAGMIVLLLLLLFASEQISERIIRKMEF